ncbi:MAG: ATP-binding protein, partial [Candidatus Omnitrophica bacterium]|nr:ATP-binding protein [Candidatus Omnitrophota bacterium]
ALALVGARRGSLMLVDDISGELYIKAGRGMSEEVMGKTRVKIGEQICGKVAFNRSPVLVRNIELDAEFKMPNKQQYETKSFISMPLLRKVSASEEKVLGVLNITDKVSGGSFTERDYTLLFVLCGQAAAAIENRNLYGDLEDKTELLNRHIKELNDIQSQLIQSEKMAAVGHIAYGITREISSPLQAILDSINTLGTTWEDHVRVDRSTMDAFKKTITRANTVITDLFKFAQISKQEFETVNICRIADEAISLIETQYDIKNIRIKKEYECDTMLFSADPAMLRQMVFNLCLNSFEAMPHGGDLILRIFVPPGKKDQNGSGAIVMEVEDTGSGIPEEIMVRIFNPFFTTKEDKGCLGLGLSIVHLILERHNALINVESVVNKGTKFTIIFSGAHPEGLPGLLSSGNV